MHAVSSMRGKMSLRWLLKRRKIRRNRKKRNNSEFFFLFDKREAEEKEKNDHADGSMIRNLSVCIRAYSFHVHQADIGT